MLGRSKFNECAFIKIIATIYLEILTCSPCIHNVLMELHVHAISHNMARPSIRISSGLGGIIVGGIYLEI